MSRTVVTRAALLAAALLTLLTGAAEAAQGAYGRAGRWITDDQGRVTVMTGWNVINKVAPYTPEAAGFDAEDARYLRSQGFNTVRLGVMWKAIEPQPGEYDEAYLDSIERTYDLLTANGIAVLLNMHQDMYNERFQGAGFPDWTVLGDARWLPRTHLGFPNNYAFSYALQRAYDHFWNNERAADGRRLWDAYAEAWARVAARFAGKPQLLGYNLMNEPFAGTAAYPCFKKMQGCPRFDRHRLTVFHRRVIAAIRGIDPAGIVWYSPMVTFNFGITTSHGDTGDDRAGFAFNTYCQNTRDNIAMGLLTYYHLGRSCGRLADLILDHAGAQAARYDDAVLMTEWAGPDPLSVLKADVESAERHMLSWQQWAYWNHDGGGPRPKDGLIFDQQQPPTGANVKQDRLFYSARVRPTAVSGTPLSWRFDTTANRFAFTYSTQAAGPSGARFADGAETTIEIPPVHLPGDYAVTVAGARVVSEPGARSLTVASCPGATTISVGVAPGATAPAARTCP